jgi:CheY-like chemotaxis protein
MTLLSDDNLLLALLRNLINNAVKYTHRGGVLVGARQRGDRALIQVWDTGIGIAPEQLDMIFEEYFQVGNPERDRSKGVGLGLAIVRRLSELLGADIRCRSCVDKGSVFEISVPLLHGSGRPAEPDDIYATALGGTLEGGRDHGLDRALERLSGKRIVVVEDDAMAAEAVKLTLEMHRVKVTLFHSAEAALQSAEVKGADYYLSDYRLSGMDGVQFLDAIQKNSPTRIKAVLLTGDTSPERIAAARSSGWTVFFKPVDLRSVLSAMEW